MGKSAMLGSLEDTLAMSQAIPGVEPCVDFAHLHARPGDGSMNTYDEWSRLLGGYAKTLGETGLQRMHIHLSGIEYGPKGERNHLPLAEADLDIPALFALCTISNVEGEFCAKARRWRKMRSKCSRSGLKGKPFDKRGRTAWYVKQNDAAARRRFV